MRFRLASPILGVILALSGCAPRRPLSWQLVAEERGHRLLPPRVSPLSGEFTLRRARSEKAKGPACRLDEPGIRLEWRGRDARISADAAALAPSPGMVLESVSPGAPAATQASVVVRSNWYHSSLVPALHAQAKTGCLSEADIQPFTLRLIDNLALPTPAAYRLAYGEYAPRGYIDIDARFRFRLVEPIRDKGVVTGYRTSYYLLEPAPPLGARVVAGDSELTTAAGVTRGAAPDHPLLHLPPRATRFRFFFRSWSVSQDRRIALIAAPSPAALDDATTAFEQNPEAWCSAAQASGAACISVAADTVIGPELRVSANGRPEYVPVGGSLADLLRSLNVRDMRAVLNTLKIARPYEGALRPVVFDRTQAQILSLVFVGGEQLTW